MEKTLSFGRNHLLFISIDGGVSSCGSNEFQALGYNSDNDIFFNQSPKSIEYFKGKTAIQVGAGLEFSLVLLNDGSVYFFGKDGHRSDDDNGGRIPQPIISLPKNIVQIAVSNYHAAALTSHGQLFIWQYGDTKGVTEEVSGLKDIKIKKIVLSNTIALALAEDNSLRSFKLAGTKGVEWLGSKDEPCVLSNLGELAGLEVQDMKAGEEHLLILTTNGSVLACGNGEVGQLGLSSVKEAYPKKIAFFEGKGVKKIAAGSFFSAVLTYNGVLWYFGIGGSNQCICCGAKCNTSNCVYSPTEVKRTNLEITDIHASSSSDNLVVLSKGILFDIDSNNHIYINYKSYKLFPDNINDLYVPWTTHNHKYHSKEIKNAVIILMSDQKYTKKLKLPKVILYMIFDFLSRLQCSHK